MVVGLLVMLAMIGTTFIIVANMDRRESRSIATAAPMKQVAGGVLQQIRAKLAADLHIDIAGVIYGSAADYKQQVDYPHEDYDRHLASFDPAAGGFWKHLSNIYNRPAIEVEDILAWDPLLVDTDGYGWGDAKLYPSGVTNRAGQEYYVAVRIIDASGLMNINSAYSTSAAVSGVVMPVTNISLEDLTNTATRDNVHEGNDRGTPAPATADDIIGRNGGAGSGDNIATYNAHYVQRPLNPGSNAYRPFEMSDMLALTWGWNIPDTASGRLWEALKLDGTGQFDAAKPYLTVHSASRDYIRRAVGIQNTTHRVNLNIAGFEDLFNAFYNAIPEGIVGFTDDDNARRVVAAQLAVNVIDYRDDDETTYVPTPALMTSVKLSGVKLFGIERQPFITELFYKVYKVSEAPDVYNRYSAIELFNPYKTDISIVGFKLTEGGTEKTPTGGWPDVNISPGRRIVIVSDNATIPVHADVERVLVIPGLDLDKGIIIYRSRKSDGTGPASDKDVPLGDATVNVADPDLGFSSMVVFQRDDVPSHAKYSIDVTNSFNDVDYTNTDGGGMTAGNTNLGKANDNYTCKAVTDAKPTPVFVRNGNLINLGDVSRIFYVGPSSSGVPLDKALALSPTNVSNGRLSTSGEILLGTDPQIPPACMLGDYMDVLAPDPNNGRPGTVYGRININTAPWQVIQHLPGISTMTTDIGGGKMMRERIAKDIVAYRDLLNNALGGTDYSILVAPREIATGLVNLREDEGFASPGEIAVPLAKIITPMPRNIYGNFAPNCYKITDSGTGDDGLDEITDDLSKYEIYYSWLSNQITVRSDVYIAYIRVQVGGDPAPTGPVRKYIAVIDRSNCTSINDLPNELMFAELK